MKFVYNKIDKNTYYKYDYLASYADDISDDDIKLTHGENVIISKANYPYGYTTTKNSNTIDIVYEKEDKPVNNRRCNESISTYLESIEDYLYNHGPLVITENDKKYYIKSSAVQMSTDGDILEAINGSTELPCYDSNGNEFVLNIPTNRLIEINKLRNDLWGVKVPHKNTGTTFKFNQYPTYIGFYEFYDHLSNKINMRRLHGRLSRLQSYIKIMMSGDLNKIKTWNGEK